jgi:hypothetical protein
MAAPLPPDSVRQHGRQRWDKADRPGYAARNGRGKPGHYLKSEASGFEVTP